MECENYLVMKCICIIQINQHFLSLYLVIFKGAVLPVLFSTAFCRRSYRNISLTIFPMKYLSHGHYFIEDNILWYRFTSVFGVVRVAHHFIRVHLWFLVWSEYFIGNIVHGQNFIKFYYAILSGTIFHYEILSAAIKFCPFNGQYFM
jgi:hypothetical protein